MNLTKIGKFKNKTVWHCKTSTSILKQKNRYEELLNKESNGLNYAEENEILKIDEFLCENLDNHIGLTQKQKNKFAFGDEDDILNQTNKLIKQLQNE